ncbi:hypothetical protein IU433_24110 [Nocardia puris]|uniref:hypothetical protein n=1 Tax=Nocardia puris TaxID=208602 RepID=UPI0018931F3E|nr:hypothetical protein [Nocardia puris]MBF6213221.1 hypothetical protein [Nocardia puris]MBF6370110.1 hypothetical protein [Nocardia puris]MBF6462100.1 hypothetical protein [Nocardia puris]
MTGAQVPRVRAVTAYLSAHGWTVTAGWRDAQVWSLREFDVLVPASDELADTPSRIRDLARCVADAEDRSPRAVWRDLGSPPADLLLFRARDDIDAVPLPTGARTVGALRDLLLHCAREAADEARPGDARALLDRARLSLSDRPFGVDVAVPHAGPDSLGRRTALRVRHSSAAASAAARQDADPAAHLADLSDAVCRALADLAGPDGVSLGFRWVGTDSPPPDTVELPGGAGEVLRAEVRARGRRAEPVPDRERPVPGVVEGVVVGLADDAEGDRRRITVRGVLRYAGAPHARRRSVRVRLPGDEDYRVALDAHSAGRAVRAEGEVTGAGRARGIVTVPGGFTVIDESHG